MPIPIIVTILVEEARPFAQCIFGLGGLSESTIRLVREHADKLKHTIAFI